MDTPDQTAPAPDAVPTPAEPAIDPAAVERAIDPKAGDAFDLGGKSFTLSYLTVERQNDLDRLLKPWFATAGVTLPPAEQLELLRDSIVPAAALILSQQDPSADAAWVAQLAGPGIRQRLFGIVMQQVQLDEVGKFYAVLSQTVGLLRRATSAAPR